MAYGRIKRSRSKIYARTLIRNSGADPARIVPIEAAVWRSLADHRDEPAGRYAAMACVRRGRKGSGEAWNSSKTCGRIERGRTPQSAVAKAVKSLSGAIAKRGR